MYPKPTTSQIGPTALKLVLLPAALLLHTSFLNASEIDQYISFAATHTEIPPTQSRVTIGLKRFGSLPLKKKALSLPLEVKYPQSKSTTTAYFPPGSSDGTCMVQLPKAGTAEADMTITLRLTQASNIQIFSRIAHVVRRKAQSSLPNPQTINAVIFSGAETPANAVEGVGRSPTVEGGIVALGGSPLSAVLFQARLKPTPEYASGTWNPPLYPQALVVQFGPSKSNTAQ